jgi:hypothetical protein
MPRQHRHGYAADLHRDLLTDTPSRLRSRPSTPDGRALHPGPYPPDLSRCLAYGALPLVPVVYRLISLAGPNPSGSTRPSRLCQRCFPPSPTSPGSDCPQLQPSCCNNQAAESSHLHPATSEVDPERPASVSTGGFLRAASRTRRAPQSAPGSPQVQRITWFSSCCARPWCRNACSPVVVALRADPGRIEQPDISIGGPDAVASA